jgi:TonB family protein
VRFGRHPGTGLDAGHCLVAVGIQLGAMNYFSNTQETVSRFGDCIDDLHDVFRCHDVDFGSAEDFFAFARTLKYHSDLRGDVLRVVKAVMESETNVSFRTILTVIAVASGGPEIASSEREMSIPVKLVIESLIGVGVCSQLTAEHPGLYSDLTVKEMGGGMAAESSLSPGGGEAMGRTEVNASVMVVAPDESSTGGAEAAGHADEPGRAGMEGTVLDTTALDTTALETTASDSSDAQSLPGVPSVPSVSSSQGSRNGYSGPSDGHHGGLNDFGGSNTLAESLSRLELNSLQLKIYLDSIDQRISRMEPRLENVAPHVLSAPPVHTREESAPRYSATIPAATIPGEAQSRLPESDAADSSREGVAATRDIAATSGRAASGPVASRSSRRPVALPVLVGVVMLLLAAFLFWRYGHVVGDAVMGRVNASAEGGAAGTGVAPAATSVTDAPASAGREAQVAAVDNPAAASVGAKQGNSSTPVHTGHGVSRPLDKFTPSSDKPAPSSSQTPTSLRSPSPSSAASAGDTDASEMAADSTEAPAAPVRTYNLSSAPSSNRLVNVSSGVMAANLLSGPKPSYPTLASLTHTQGNVVMQVVISKSGTVEHLNVIKGHRLLRGAATSAVRTWRYRPYKIGGVPVEVATIVSVDFSLHR